MSDRTRPRLEPLEDRVVPAAGIPMPDHVVIVIEENHSFNEILGAGSPAPDIRSLAADPMAAVFTQSFAVEHPSQPNYLDLFAGGNQGVLDDNVPAGLPFTTANLGALLLGKGLTFAGYSEDLPAVGSDVASSGDYARKHNPWVNWQGAGVNGIPPTANQPLTDFPTDYSTLPTVSFVVPNLADDMHDGSDPARIAAGDAWLQTHLDGYVQWAKSHNSLFILTFDEDDSSQGNHIPTLFLGPMVRQGDYGETINHYNLLRTLEDMYGLPYAGSSSTAAPITDVWIDPAQERFVAALYRDFLGRTASPAETHAWAQVLPQIGPDGVSRAIVGSFEAEQRQVTQFYTYFLNRTPAGDEVNGWANYLQGGGSREQVIAAILASDEFAARANALIGGSDANANYVRALYSLLLQRTPSASEVNGWLGSLPSMGRTNVALWFVQSPEFRGIAVRALYGVTSPAPPAFLPNLLHRTGAPSAGEVNGWISSPLDLASIEAALAGSSEYFNNA
jgi:acid phosphatase